MNGGREASGSGSNTGSNTGACPFLRRQSLKRSHSAMVDDSRSSSPDSLFVSDSSHRHNAHPTQRHMPLALPPTSRRTRYVGDGLDYRRPVGTAAGMSNTVIDLTLEDDTHSARAAPQASTAAATAEPGPSRQNTQQRLPSFQSRHIVDVESDVEHEDRETSHGASRGGPSEPQTHRHRQHHDHHFPEPRYPLRASEIMDNASSSSTTAAPSRRLPRPWDTTTAQRSITPHPTGGSTQRNNTTIDLTTDDDDDVIITEARPRVRPQLNTGRPEITAGTGTIARGFMDRVLGMGGRPVAVAGEGGVGGMLHRLLAGQGGAAPANNAPHIPQNVRAPAVAIGFDYLTVAFAVGGEPARPATPNYEAPPPAEPGFTRSPGENEEIVCPNCGDELCTGKDEVKQQVWVIKGCGHAYCGGCASNRGPAKKTPKGKGKAKVEVSSNTGVPMKKCQVLGCGTVATGKSMLRVFVDG